MTFRVGQKVVCIRSACPSSFGCEAVPRKGGVYTVRSIRDFGGEGAGITLVEIVNPVLDYRSGRDEAYFHVSIFRPVVERKTDISIFTAMLSPVREDA